MFLKCVFVHIKAQDSWSLLSSDGSGHKIVMQSREVELLLYQASLKKEYVLNLNMI